MATNLAIDDQLLHEALEISGLKTKKDTVNGDYDLAAEFSNKCRKKGFQGSYIDFLICAVASRIDIPIFTNDKDFEHYQNIISVKLFKIEG